jgi:homogentisate 1,2-dioxygenase
MPLYHMGDFPSKDTQFENQKEVLLRTTFGTEGFSGNSALLYHVHRPTQVKEILKSIL